MAKQEFKPYTTHLRIRHWKGKAAFKYRQLRLGKNVAATPVLQFKPDTVHEVKVDTPALHKIVYRACRGGGLEMFDPDPLGELDEGPNVVTPGEDSDPLA